MDVVMVQEKGIRNIPLAEPFIGERELKYVTECIKTRWISSLGSYVIRFEEEFADYCGTKYGISTSNGTTALHLALVALGISDGDEVLIPDMTFIATANAVRYCGAEPVFVDIEPITWNMDPNDIKKRITPKTKAIIPVHTYGHPCDMDPIIEIADSNDLLVIEDAAEAHGAEYKGKKVGSIGDVACFSFYGNKIITTGEGGMITTNNEEFTKKAKMLRDHAMSEKNRYWHTDLGFNYRLTNIQAAIGVAQLEKIDEIIDIKRKNAKYYNSLFKDVERIVTPPEEKWAKSVYWMYSILVEDDFGVDRDLLMKKLGEKGIDTRPFFYPIHSQPPYANAKADFPISEEISKKGINLPSSPYLNQDEIEYIAETTLSLRKP